ncbi:RHS repeat-associated core domain-containing protein [Chloroflexota bacterium]
MTTGANTTSYFLGSQLVATHNGTDLMFVHQDHLSGTSIMTSDNGTLINSIKYYPFGESRNSQGTLATDKLFTGQRFDGTGLYYYNARYYDPTIGRFISADTIIPDPTNPQAYNKYSYVINNPLIMDPSGRDYIFVGGSRGNGSRPGWVDEMIKALEIDKSGERVVFLGDNDAGVGVLDPYVGDQYAMLKAVLEEDVLTDVKIIGFSEGAAATVMVLDDIANGAQYGDEITHAIMLETPRALFGYDNNKRIDLPDRLAEEKSGNKGIVVGDFRNTASFVSSDPGWGGGADSYYDSFFEPWPWLEAAAYYANPWAGVAATAINQIVNHNDITTDQRTYDFIGDVLSGEFDYPW